MRRKIVAGNWKMNCTLQEGKKLVSEIVQMVQDGTRGNVETVLIPPFPHLPIIQGLISSAQNIFLGAQNCHERRYGAFTGEVSASMLVSAGVQYVILGHSERREYFGETDELLAEKIKHTLNNGLIPIFCCGESLAVREGGNQKKTVGHQIKKALFKLSIAEISKLVVAYEPVWAIGTGQTATSEQVEEMHMFIRSLVALEYGVEVANDIPILYGGSVKPDNAKEIFLRTDVDGGLVGGASLNAWDFVEIIKAFD